MSAGDQLVIRTTNNRGVCCYDLTNKDGILKFY